MDNNKNDGMIEIVKIKMKFIFTIIKQDTNLKKMKNIKNKLKIIKK